MKKEIVHTTLVTGCSGLVGYHVVKKLIEAEINSGSKDYDLEYIRNHVNKLTS